MIRKKPEDQKAKISAVVCDCCFSEIVPPMLRYSLDTPAGDCCSEECISEWISLNESERARRRVQALKETRAIVKDLQERRIMRALPEMQKLHRVKTPKKGFLLENSLNDLMAIDAPTGAKFYRRVA